MSPDPFPLLPAGPSLLVPAGLALQVQLEASASGCGQESSDHLDFGGVGGLGVTEDTIDLLQLCLPRSKAQEVVFVSCPNNLRDEPRWSRPAVTHQ